MNRSALDFRDRAGLFRAFNSKTFDLLVIGAGITGAGIARDAAMRGLDVALVEAQDFASGTSSRSSKMVHGGLRYLQQGEVGLVREAASERKILHRIAPHLARPMPFVLPAHSKGVLAKLKTGMWMFEKLGAVPKTMRHETWSPAELAKNEPAMRTEKLAGAVVYTEYLTDDARLTLANVRSAKAAGATVISYAPVVRIIEEQGKAVGAEINSALEGEALKVTLRAKVIVNAAGPWVDALRGLEDAKADKRLQLTKGIHVVVPKSRLPIDRTIIIRAPDKRSIFAVPRGDAVYLGTTDTFYAETHYWPRIERPDVDYLLDAAALTFSTKKLEAQDVVATWSGVRPLVAQDGKKPSDISRKNEVWTGPGGMLSVAGGKLTAYRKMAQRIVDDVETLLGHAPTPCRTDQEALPGGDCDINTTERLAALYGTEASQVMDAGGDIAAEVSFAVTCEGALKLEDYWVRRSVRACFDPDGGLGILDTAATIMADLLGWSYAKRQQQIEECKQIRKNSFAWADDALATKE
jgi:glycerol-3-phosphate dehydrogenase